MADAGYPEPRSPTEQALIAHVERLEGALADLIEMLHDRNDTHVDVRRLLERSDRLRDIVAES